MIQRMLRLSLCAWLVAVLLPGVAEAKSFRGETSQKRVASVVVGVDGRGHPRPDQLQRAVF